jgi:hypothetical protein
MKNIFIKTATLFDDLSKLPLDVSTLVQVSCSHMIPVMESTGKVGFFEDTEETRVFLKTVCEIWDSDTDLLMRVKGVMEEIPHGNYVEVFNSKWKSKTIQELYFWLASDYQHKTGRIRWQITPAFGTERLYLFTEVPTDPMSGYFSAILYYPKMHVVKFIDPNTEPYFGTPFIYVMNRPSAALKYNDKDEPATALPGYFGIPKKVPTQTEIPNFKFEDRNVTVRLSLKSLYRGNDLVSDEDLDVDERRNFLNIVKLLTSASENNYGVVIDGLYYWHVNDHTVNSYIGTNTTVLPFYSLGGIENSLFYGHVPKMMSDISPRFWSGQSEAIKNNFNTVYDTSCIHKLCDGMRAFKDHCIKVRKNNIDCIDSYATFSSFFTDPAGEKDPIKIIKKDSKYIATTMHGKLELREEEIQIIGEKPSQCSGIESSFIDVLVNNYCTPRCNVISGALLMHNSHKDVMLRKELRFCQRRQLVTYLCYSGHTVYVKLFFMVNEIRIDVYDSYHTHGYAHHDLVAALTRVMKPFFNFYRPVRVSVTIYINQPDNIQKTNECVINTTVKILSHLGSREMPRDRTSFFESIVNIRARTSTDSTYTLPFVVPDSFKPDTMGDVTVKKTHMYVRVSGDVYFEKEPDKIFYIDLAEPGADAVETVTRLDEFKTGVVEKVTRSDEFKTDAVEKVTRLDEIKTDTPEMVTRLDEFKTEQRRHPLATTFGHSSPMDTVPEDQLLRVFKHVPDRFGKIVVENYKLFARDICKHDWNMLKSRFIEIADARNTCFEKPEQMHDNKIKMIHKLIHTFIYAQFGTFLETNGYDAFDTNLSFVTQLYDSVVTYFFQGL